MAVVGTATAVGAAVGGTATAATAVGAATAAGTATAAGSVGTLLFTGPAPAVVPLLFTGPFLVPILLATLATAGAAALEIEEYHHLNDDILKHDSDATLLGTANHIYDLL